MSYVKTNWVNGPNTATPLSAPNLNHLEGQYDAVKDDIADPSSPIGTVLSTTIDDALVADQPRQLATIGGQVDEVGIDARRHGVLADGVTDDTTALDAVTALASSAFARTNVVILPPGTILTSGTDLPTKVMLRGHAYGSRLKLKDNSNRPVIRLSALTTQAVQIHNLTIDGNKANQTGGVSHGIHMNNQSTAINPSFEAFWQDCYHTVSNVLITNCDGDGIRTSGRGDTILSGIRSMYNNGDGFRIDSFDTILNNCIAGMNVGNGFNITMPNDTMTGCKAFMNANGFRFNGRGVIATGLVAQGNIGDGALLVGCTDSQIEISAFDNNYNQSPDLLTGMGVRFTASSNRNRVRIMAWNQEAPARQHAAYYIPSGSQNVVEVTTDGSMPLRPNSSTEQGNVVKTRGSDGFTIDAYAAALAPDIAFGTTHRVTLTGGITMNRPIAGGSAATEYFPEGATLTMMFVQDATGGRTVTWGSGWIDKKWQPNPVPGSASQVTWRLYSGNWYIVGGHYPQSALTTADVSTVNSGDPTTDTVIGNMRTRLNELEGRLQKLGGLA